MQSSRRGRRGLVKGRTLIAGIVLTMFLQGCEMIDLIDGYTAVRDITWSEDGYVYFEWAVNDAPSEIHRVKEGGEAAPFLKRVPGACDATSSSVSFLTAVDEKTLGVGFPCSPLISELRLVDTRSGVTNRVVKVAGLRGAVLDRTGLYGYVWLEGHACSSVARMSDGSVRDLEAVVPYAGGTWQLKDGYRPASTPSAEPTCGPAGWSEQPAMNKAGTSVAFLTTSIPIEPQGVRPTRDRLEFRIGILQQPHTAIRLVGPTMRLPRDLAMSPDGTKIAVVTGDPEPGILLVDVATGATRRLVSHQKVADVAFSPDGATIAHTLGADIIKFIHL